MTDTALDIRHTDGDQLVRHIPAGEPIGSVAGLSHVTVSPCTCPTEEKLRKWQAWSKVDWPEPWITQGPPIVFAPYAGPARPCDTPGQPCVAECELNGGPGCVQEEP